MSRENEMKVVGMTTQQHVFVASESRKFRINEILIIEDPDAGLIKGEVIETQSFNQFIPLVTEKSRMVDASVLENLRQVGYTIDDAETNIAKVRTLSELMFPVKTGSNVRLPEFHEIEKMLIRDYKGWNVGVLRGTEEIAHQLPDALKNKGLLLSDKGLSPYQSVPFLFEYKSMYEYPHFGIFGGSGSGKSYCSRVIEEEIMKCRIPTIVADPHYEKEYKDYFEGMPEEFRVKFKSRYETYTIGKEVGIPFEQLHVNELINLLASSSAGITENMETTVRQIFTHRSETLESFKGKIDALNYAFDYTRQLESDYEAREGMDAEERSKVEYMYKMFMKYKDKSNPSSIKGIQWRLNRLIGFRLFSKDIRPILDAMKARKMVVIRGSIEHLKLFLSYVLRKVYDLRRGYKDSISQGTLDKEYFPPFITVLDEAHNFAPKSMDVPTKGVLKEISQEGRKYGAFLGFATQRPALLDDTIMAQLSTKFLFRTVRGQDIQSLSEETDLSKEDANRLPYLPSGECFVSSAVIGRTIAARVRAAITKSPNSMNPFDELDVETTSMTNPLSEEILNSLPFDDSQLFQLLKTIESKTNVRSSMNELKSVLEELGDQGRIKIMKNPFGNRYSMAE